MQRAVVWTGLVIVLGVLYAMPQLASGAPYVLHILVLCCLFAIPAVGIYPWYVAPLAGLGAGSALPALRLLAAPRPVSPPAGYALWPLWHVGAAFVAGRPAMGALFVGLLVGALTR